MSFFSLRYPSNEADVKGRSAVVVISVFPLVDVHYARAACPANIVS
jgi:hypothetical protein